MPNKRRWPHTLALQYTGAGGPRLLIYSQIYRR